MFGFGSFKIKTELFMLIVFALFLILQIVLCSKVKIKWLRLLPCIVFAVLTAALLAVSFFFDGWDRFGFQFLAICTAFPLLACGIGWGAWALFRKIRYTDRKASKL